jgi:hypothetical protein
MARKINRLNARQRLLSAVATPTVAASIYRPHRMVADGGFFFIGGRASLPRLDLGRRVT